MNGTENGRLRRAVERLMDGQREVLEVLRRALDGDTPAERALVDLEDILEGSLKDARNRNRHGEPVPGGHVERSKLDILPSRNPYACASG